MRHKISNNERNTNNMKNSKKTKNHKNKINIKKIKENKEENFVVKSESNSLVKYAVPRENYMEKLLLFSFIFVFLILTPNITQRPFI